MGKNDSKIGMKYNKSDSCLYNNNIICKEKDNCIKCCWNPNSEKLLKKVRLLNMKSN